MNYTKQSEVKNLIRSNKDYINSNIERYKAQFAKKSLFSISQPNAGEKLMDDEEGQQKQAKRPSSKE